MGVHGLWRLIDPSGKVVPLETLENKVLAVDLSIWLHQAIKGFRDANGAPVANAHLLAIYHRVCKLLYYKIKPVFVFDGGVPALKRQTIEKRNQLKAKNSGDVNHIQKKLLSTLLKHSAVNKVLSERTKNSLGASTSKICSKTEETDDIFKLPPCEFEETFDSSSEDEEESYSSCTEDSTTDTSPTKNWDIYTIDVNSKEFKALPPDVRYEILSDLKETRKQSSWRRIHEIPTHSGDFANYQMQRLLKRQSIQSSLEEAEKEMGGRSLSLNELELLLQDQGVLNLKDKMGKRIAKDSETHYLYIKDMKKAIETARKEEELKKIEELEEVKDEDKEHDEELALAIKLSLEHETNSSHDIGKDDVENIKPNDTLAIKMSFENSNASANSEMNKLPSLVTQKSNDNDEYDDDLALAIKLSLENEPSTSKSGLDDPKEDIFKAKTLKEMSFLDNMEFSSDESEDFDDKETGNEVLSSAKNYMLEYSGLTPSEVSKILCNNKKPAKKPNTLSKLSKMINAKSADVVFESSKQSINAESSTKIIFVASKDKAIKISTPCMSETITSADKQSVETVDEISDSGSSDGDFVEIPLEEKRKTQEKSDFEVIVQPTIESLEDDIFADIFENDNKQVCDKNTESGTKKRVNFSDKVEVKFIEKIDDKTVPENNIKTTSDINSSIDSNTSIVNEDNKVKISSDAVKEVEVDKTEKLVEKNSEIAIENKNKTAASNEKVVEQRRNVSTAELHSLQDELLVQEQELLAERNQKERLATNITDQMYQEAQELLELFGVPYIIAPMEAEAQCAFLEQINLTDGTITDDSDIWLFGGQIVYKNFFNQNKHVLEFRSENVQHHFKLTRYQLILLALLVGSDYTMGLPGIGPVTALEILATFPNKSKVATDSIRNEDLISGLKDFKSWFLKEKANVKPRIGLRNRLKNLAFSQTFPSLTVVEAYLTPTVDSSDEKFTWAKPDINSLKIFAKQKFGWTDCKSEEILKPVIKRMTENRSQMSIKDFFKSNQKYYSEMPLCKMSKRTLKAVERFGKDSDENSSESEEPKRKSKKKNSTKSFTSKNGAVPKQKSVKQSENEEETTEIQERKASKRKYTKKKDNDNEKLTTVKQSEKDNEHTDEQEGKPSKRKYRRKQGNRNEDLAQNKCVVNSSEKNSENAVENIELNTACHKNSQICNSEASSSQKPNLKKLSTRNAKEKPNAKSLKHSVSNDNINLGNFASTTQNTTRKRSAASSSDGTLSVEHLLEKKSRLKQELSGEIPLNSRLQPKKRFPHFKNVEEKKLPPQLAKAVKLLNATKVVSQKKVQEINTEVTKDIERAVVQAQQKVNTPQSIVKKEYIHQKEQGKTDMLKSKLKAIETFRKSKKGPGYMKKRAKVVRAPKEDAGLSESSDE